jgi:DNA adenine methylase
MVTTKNKLTKATKESLAKPFLKWAGGKTQLLNQFQQLYPPELGKNQIVNYVEPFIGGGAVFFDIMQNNCLSSAFIYDINPELIIAYNVIKKDVENLIEFLTKLSNDYKQLDDDGRKEYFYQIRDKFNVQRKEVDIENYSKKWITRTALLIFLNRTCFNGLFRLNKSGGFNVPHGRYQNPKIVDENNLIAVSRILQVAQINLGDFSDCFDQINDQTFVYFDPPYRPLNTTANFTSYSTADFGDRQQIRLGKFFAEINHQTKAKLMLSNSDPKNENINDNFFDDLYQEFNIHRVSANRMINSNASKRGNVSEIVVTNY